MKQEWKNLACVLSCLRFPFQSYYHNPPFEAYFKIFFQFSFLCMHICDLDYTGLLGACACAEARREHWDSWSWNYGCLVLCLLFRHWDLNSDPHKCALFTTGQFLRCQELPWTCIRAPVALVSNLSSWLLSAFSDCTSVLLLDAS